jgi:hypothetical protein
MTTELKKDHSIGAGTGAVAGAITGAALGAAAGPIGSVVGAVAGGIVGAKAGDSIAEAVNPTDYTEHFEREYRRADHAGDAHDWRDYGPAYTYAYTTYAQHRERGFDAAEADLERDWPQARGESRLDWPGARDAVRDGWRHIDRRREDAAPR